MKQKKLALERQPFSILRTMEFDSAAIPIKPASKDPVDPAAITFVCKDSIFKYPNAVRHAVVNG